MVVVAFACPWHEVGALVGVKITLSANCLGNVRLGVGALISLERQTGHAKKKVKSSRVDKPRYGAPPDVGVRFMRRYKA